MGELVRLFVEFGVSPRRLRRRIAVSVAIRNRQRFGRLFHLRFEQQMITTVGGNRNDIIIPLDELPPYHVDRQELSESVDRYVLKCRMY